MFTILALIFGHIFVIGGCYLLAWNMNRLLKISANPRDILTKSLFWGLIAIMGGFCFFFAILLWDKIFH